jgi:hypothetical protein
MGAIASCLPGEKRGSLTVGDKVKRTVFEVSEPFFVEAQATQKRIGYFRK